MRRYGMSCAYGKVCKIYFGSRRKTQQQFLVLIFEIHQAKLSNLLCVSMAARAKAPCSKISYFCWSWVRIPLQTEKITIIFFPSLFFFLFLLNCVSHTLRGHSQAMWTSKGEGKYFKFHLCINQLVVVSVHYFLLPPDETTVLSFVVCKNPIDLKKHV